MTNSKPRLAEFKPIGHNPKFKTFPVVKPIIAPTKGDMTRARVVSREEAQRSLIHSALAVPNPNAGLGRFVSADDEDGTTFKLPIESLREYDNIPRRRTHASLTDLKESIRAKGILQIITVTKRPGEDFYIPYSGGNSRLKCAKQLFEERCERYERFAHLQVAYRAYTSESDIFAAHITENEVRADIPFWEKAKAAMELKRMIEAEQGRSLSVRELEAAFASKGIPSAKTSINYFAFAHIRLSELCCVVTSFAAC